MVDNYKGETVYTLVFGFAILSLCLIIFNLDVNGGDKGVILFVILCIFGISNLKENRFESLYLDLKRRRDRDNGI